MLLVFMDLSGIGSLFSCRCGQIMGRSETEVLSAAQILYPCMQCADIFLLEVSFIMHTWFISMYVHTSMLDIDAYCLTCVG